MLTLSLLTTTLQVAQLTLRELICIDLAVFLSGAVSGLSGFGFSAIGSVTQLLLPPTLQIPLFQTLSLGNQVLSIRQLREDMPRSKGDLWAGPGPCMLGGAAGAPVGVWLLSNVPASELMTIFGALLTAHAIYSVLKPLPSKSTALGGPAFGFIIGFVGSVIGGFTAFPAAAVVVWTGVRGLSKVQRRAIVQPYILLSQAYSLGLLVWLHPGYLDGRFCAVLALTLPAALPGTLGGIAVYRRLSDFNFGHVTYFLLGFAGLALLARVYGPPLLHLLQ